jgi:hypothetical protein
MRKKSINYSKIIYNIYYFYFTLNKTTFLSDKCAGKKVFIFIPYLKLETYKLVENTKA